MTDSEVMALLKGLPPDKAVAKLNMLEYAKELDPGHADMMRRKFLAPQGTQTPSMSSAPLRISSTNYVPPTPMASQPQPEVIDLNELHRKALARAEEVPDLIQQTGYGHQLIQQAQPPQMQTPPQRGGASLNFAIPQSVLEGADDPRIAGSMQRPEAPSQFVKGYKDARAQEAADPGLVIPEWPVHPSGTPPMATSPAEYRAHQKEVPGYQDGYYVGTPKENPNEEINRLNRAQELEQPSPETIKDVQASVDANQIKSPKPIKQIGMLDSDVNPDPWADVHHMGDARGSFFDEVAKTFKLTSDIRAKTDVQGPGAGITQLHGGVAGDMSQVNYTANGGIDQTGNPYLPKPGPPAVTWQSTGQQGSGAPPGSQNWNAAQWDAFHKNNPDWDTAKAPPPKQTWKPTYGEGIYEKDPNPYIQRPGLPVNGAYQDRWNPDMMSKPLTPGSRRVVRDAYGYEHDSNDPNIVYSDEREKQKDPATHDVDGFLESLAKSYSTYRYKDPSKEPTDTPTGGRYMGVMAQAVEKSPTGDTLVKDDPSGTKYLEEKPNLSAALAALGRLYEMVKELQGQKR